MIALVAKLDKAPVYETLVPDSISGGSAIQIDYRGAPGNYIGFKSIVKWYHVELQPPNFGFKS
jgi:hypothetical protein